MATAPIVPAATHISTHLTSSPPSACIPPPDIIDIASTAAKYTTPAHIPHRSLFSFFSFPTPKPAMNEPTAYITIAIIPSCAWDSLSLYARKAHINIRMTDTITDVAATVKTCIIFFKKRPPYTLLYISIWRSLFCDNRIFTARSVLFLCLSL